jgi:hypothetical protein
VISCRGKRETGMADGDDNKLNTELGTSIDVEADFSDFEE